MTLLLPKSATLGVVFGEVRLRQVDARALHLCRLINPDGGAIHLNGRDLAKLTRDEMRAETVIQMVFQDVLHSTRDLRPANSSRQGLIVHGTPRYRRARRRSCSRSSGSIPPRHDRYPHEFSRRAAPAHRACARSRWNPRC